MRLLILTRLWWKTLCPHQVRAPSMPSKRVRLRPKSRLAQLIRPSTPVRHRTCRRKALRFSISARVSNALDAAIAAVADDAWQPAVNTDGQPRRGAQVAELDLTVDGWPDGTRAIVRRERPHPGAQLRLWDHDGMRHQVVLTNSAGDPVSVELRHRRHGQVREPHQEPQGLRPRTHAVHLVRIERGVDGDGPHRRRPARLDQDTAA